MSNQVIYAVVRAVKYERDTIVKMYRSQTDADLYSIELNDKKTAHDVMYYVEEYEVYG